jgi:hypothetical protein
MCTDSNLIPLSILHNPMIEDKEQVIKQKMAALLNYRVDPMPMNTATFKDVTMLQMDLMIELFDRQHKDVQTLDADVKQLTSSSRSIEKLTYWLIGLTLVLGVLAGIDVLGRFFVP